MGVMGCGSGCGRVRTYVVICHGKWYLNITEYRDLFILYQTIYVTYTPHTVRTYVRTYTILKNGRMLTDGTGGCGRGVVGVCAGLSWEIEGA